MRFLQVFLILSLITSSAFAIKRLGNKKFEDIADYLNIPTKNGRCDFSRRNLVQKDIALDLNRNLKNQNLPYWDCHFLRKSIRRDIVACNPKVEDVTPANVQKKRVIGALTYTGIVPLPYHYNVNKLNNDLYEIEVNIYLRKLEKLGAEVEEKMRDKIEAAQDYWNDHNKDFPGYVFNFNLVKNRAKAHFSPKIINEDTRGPYLATWSTMWSTKVVAHEIGHMMGLDDEYDNIATTFRRKAKHWLNRSRCHRDSFMCSTSHLSSTPRKWHYYNILKRTTCKAKLPTRRASKKS